jgi:lysine 2,3-aminomutase
MRHTARCGFDLVEAGVIAPERAAEVDRVAEQYPVAVTPEILDLIDANDPNDPIARQFVPSAAELDVTPEERDDPIGDHRFSPVKGLVHRYPDRVLLKLTHACPVYCRFCFRREMVGPGGEALNAAELQTALDYVRAHPEIWEVIVTGGDPLMLAPRRLAELMQALGAIEHLGAVRFHSRVPIVDSGRIEDELVAALASAKAVHVIVHCNHPRELTDAAMAACRRFIAAGIPVLAQTVLLKGINDDAATLAELFRGLVRNRIRPYYLHHADLAPSSAPPSRKARR